MWGVGNYSVISPRTEVLMSGNPERESPSRKGGAAGILYICMIHVEKLGQIMLEGKTCLLC